MSERLAIKTDQVEAWDRGKIGPVVKNLTPRATDNGRKSSWAHCANEQGELLDIVQDPAKATCKLQALAMYMFSERHSLTSRNRVTGVSLFREAIQEHLYSAS